MRYMTQASSPNRYNFITLLLTLTVAAIVTIAAPTDAEAQVILGAEAAAAAPIGSFDVESGTRYEVRLGYALPIPLLVIMPELAVDRTAFGEELELYSVGAGLRVGLDGPLRPSAFAHVGRTFAGRSGADAMGRTLDGGIALDFTLIPQVDLGVSTTYTALTMDADPITGDTGEYPGRWISFGAHVAVEF